MAPGPFERRNQRRDHIRDMDEVPRLPAITMDAERFATRQPAAEDGHDAGIG